MPMAEEQKKARIAPLRESLTVCPICGQIYDAHHMGKAFHHRHEGGEETPLIPDMDPPEQR